MCNTVAELNRKVDRMRRFLVLQPQSTLLEAAAVIAAIYLCRALLPYFPFSLLALLLQQPLSGLRVEAVADSSNNLGGKRPTVKCSEAAAAAHAIVFFECYAPFFPLLFLFWATYDMPFFKGGKMEELPGNKLEP